MPQYFYRGNIITAEMAYPPTPKTVGMSAPERCVAQYWRLGGVPGPSAVSPVTGQAIVNHGRWVVMCPWCPSAQVASPIDRRFFCTQCGNVAAHGRWINVLWPDNWTDIAGVLLQRLDTESRNWAPPETIDDLQADNNIQGVV